MQCAADAAVRAAGAVQRAGGRLIGYYHYRVLRTKNQEKNINVNIWI